MTAAVVDTFSSSTPPRPDKNAASAAARGGQLTVAGGFSAPSSVSPPRLPLTIERDSDGTYVVADRQDQVVGTGVTADAALVDFSQSLRQHVAYLRENRERLHPRLLADLERLQRDFPWV